MIVSQMLANITPACRCGGYIEKGETLQTVRGSAGMKQMWWVACPDCGSTLGRALEHPVTASPEILTRRGYKNEPDANA